MEPPKWTVPRTRMDGLAPAAYGGGLSGERQGCENGEQPRRGDLDLHVIPSERLTLRGRSMLRGARYDLPNNPPRPQRHQLLRGRTPPALAKGTADGVAVNAVGVQETSCSGVASP